MEEWSANWIRAEKEEQRFQAPNTAQLIARLKHPDDPVDVVLDTDTYNEIDDQFALAYLIRSTEKLTCKAVYAAPFFNQNAGSPAEGMEKSYQEILHILKLAGRSDLCPNAFRGANQFLRDEETPVDSPAARDLAARAMNYTPEHPLYVVGIAAITNVASAILMNPAIIDRIVIVWLGGDAHFWPETREFNMFQDIAAARIIFNCGAALVQLPCRGVVSAFTTTGPELAFHLKDKNPLCDYLLTYTVGVAEKENPLPTWSRVIWDVTAVAWLLDNDFERDTLVHSPLISADGRYSFDDTRHFIRYVYHIDRDRVLNDLFGKLTK